ncbi:MAG: hypothetical protein H6Q69_3536 [Firmicutes bacterium]|nr:hypothetical protein [Bacillota bacterium]
MPADLKSWSVACESPVRIYIAMISCCPNQWYKHKYSISSLIYEEMRCKGEAISANDTKSLQHKNIDRREINELY